MLLIKKKRVLISVASKVDFNFFKELRTLKPAINTAGGLGACKPPNGHRAETFWGTGANPSEIFLTRFELPKLVLRLTFFNCFTQPIVLLNTSLTSVGRVFGYLFHLSSC